MNENPYQSPAAAQSTRAHGVISGNHEDLIALARYQRGIIYCILVYFSLIPAQFIFPDEVRPVIMIPVLIILMVTAAVFVFLLSTKVYGGPVGVVVALFAIIPCVGLLMLLVINAKATAILKLNGIEVGMMGTKADALSDD